SYSEDATGFLAKTPHPDHPSSSVMVLAGVRRKGTVAALQALTEHHEPVLAGYEGEDKWATVVRGLDMDGDGKIDDVEVLE
ncbi:MAG: hypothetical protein ABEK12_00070, partial [Candidatus Nanohaloarchaea archaeon]